MASIEPIKAAVLGSGRISKVYIPTIQANFHVINIVAGWDSKEERAKGNEVDFGVPAKSKEEILGDESIKIIINLTKPKQHYETTKEAFLADKHVYCEKMMAVTKQETDELLELSKEKHLCYTVAPDTFLGGGWQTARKIIEDGYIGTPLFVNGICVRSYGLYDPASTKQAINMSTGAGIAYDMGGYYLHSMCNLFGGIKRVTGNIELTNQKRSYLNPRNPKYKESFEVENGAANMLSMGLQFQSGVQGSLYLCSEADIPYQSKFEVYGTQGTLILFDPNNFGGPIYLRENKNDGIPFDCMTDPSLVPILHGYIKESRGIGVADMAYAMLNGRKPRADASLGYHAFEAIWGLQNEGKESGVYDMKSTIEKPKAIKVGIRRSGVQEAFLDD